MNKSYNVSYLDYNAINFLNKEASYNNVEIILNNTANISSDMVRRLNPNISIRVIGGLDKPKYNNYRYAYRSTYTPIELTNIIRQFERIENGIKDHWTEKNIAKYVYEQLSQNISYEYNYRNIDSREVSGLKGIINGTAICSGYALIYKEIMDRQGIRCDYVRGKTPINDHMLHAWNVLHIDGEIIPIDVTWSAGKYQNNHKITYNYFGANKEFIKNHLPEYDEAILEYKENKPVRDNIKKTDHNVELIQRNDGSYFYLSKIGVENTKGKILYKYMQTEYENNNLGRTNILYSEQDYNKLNDQYKNKFVNLLLEKNRIKKYGGISGAYLGFIADNGKKTIDKNFIDIQGNVTNINRNDNSNISLEQSKEQKYKKNDLITYNAYEFVCKDGYIYAKEDKIYSETNINYVNNNELHNFANYIIPRDRLDKKMEVNGGYVGTMTKEMKKIEYLDTREMIREEMAKCM